MLPEAEPQHVVSSLWALAKLLHRQGQPAVLSPTLPNAVIAWAGARWPQLPALRVCDLCFALARLGAQPDSSWIGAAVTR